MFILNQFREISHHVRPEGQPGHSRKYIIDILMELFVVKLIVTTLNALLYMLISISLIIYMQ